MPNVAVLLDKVRSARSLASDNALAGSLHITRQTVSQWRAGSAYPDDDKIAQLAEWAGDDPGDWMLLLRAERAEGKARKAYAGLVRRLGIAALLAIVAGPAMASHFVYSGLVVPIMSMLNRLRRTVKGIGTIFAGSLSHAQMSPL